MADGDDELARVLAAVGPRLRALRRARGTTLAALSEQTGISVSTLSRLEAGKRRPTLELLLPLARAHRVPLDELVGAPETGDPRLRQRPYSRGGRTFVPLTRYLGGLHAVKQVLPAERGGGGRPEQRAHEGYGWMYVLAGRLRLALGGEDLLLGAGEAVEFDTRVPHGFAGGGAHGAEVLCLFGRQGERVRLRARPGGR